MTIVLKTTGVSTAQNLETLRRDPALFGDSGGVKFMFDTAFGYSIANAELPANGDTIGDVSDTGNGSFVNTTTGVFYAGGGIDLKARSGAGVAHIAGPSGCLASIHAGAQDYMVVGWYKMPTALDWNAGGSVMAIFSAAAATYTTGPDLVTLFQTNVPRLEARRQTNGTTIATTSIDPNANIFGNVCQVSYWRNQSGAGIRVKSQLGQVIATPARGADNVGDFSAMVPKWGATPGAAAADNIVVYRGWVEDLEISGRDPLTVLDADFDTTIARGVFS